MKKEKKRKLDPEKVYELCGEYARLKLENEVLQLQLKLMEVQYETQQSK